MGLFSRVITEQSIGKLLISGILPGILLTALFMIAVYILDNIGSTAGPRGPSRKLRERVMALKDVWAVLVLFIVVIGGIYSGVFNATEAAAVGVFCAFLIALMRRKLTKEKHRNLLQGDACHHGHDFLCLIICAQISATSSQ